MNVKRLLLAAILGGIVVFVWGAVSWMVLPWHAATMTEMPDEDTVMSYLRDSLSESGVYHFPGMPGGDSEEAMAAFTEKHERGPIGLLIYRAAGGPPMPPSIFLGSLLMNVFYSFLLALMLSMAGPSLPTYGKRVCVASQIGFFAGAVSYGPLWHWMHHPFDYCLVNALDLFVTWTLAGLVIAAVIKPPASASEPA